MLRIDSSELKKLLLSGNIGLEKEGLLCWLVSTPDEPFSDRDQVQAVQNYKNAAHYDLKTVNITVPNGEFYSVAHAARNVIGFMKGFYRDYPEEVQEILDFEDAKFVNPENRYAWKVRRQFEGGYVKKGLELARQSQEEFPAIEKTDNQLSES